MNTSTQQSSINVPVKMGSHRMIIEIPHESNVTCDQFIEIVLKRCRLNGSKDLAKTYAMFESVNGIERLLKSNEIVLTLCERQIPQFVIRKIHPVERKLSNVSQQNAKKFYKKLRSIDNTNKQVINEVHIYEQVDNKENVIQSPNTVQLNYLKQVLKNEMKLRRQAKKLLKVEQSIHQHVVNLEKNLIEQLVIKNQNFEETLPKTEAVVPSVKPKICAFHQEKIQTNLNAKLADNINFLKFLHFKLKSSNKNQTNIYRPSESNVKKSLFAYKKMEELNSSGTSDENSSSQCNSRSTSTSTLESLV